MHSISYNLSLYVLTIEDDMSNLLIYDLFIILMNYIKSYIIAKLVPDMRFFAEITIIMINTIFIFSKSIVN